MTDSPTRTALVTRATSGLGLEAAAQLAEAAYDRVVVTGRHVEKAETACRALAKRVGRDGIEALALDLGRSATRPPPEPSRRSGRRSGCHRQAKTGCS